jgi:hypothetical protein
MEMECSWFEKFDETSQPLKFSAEQIRKIRQNMIEYLRRECPELYGDLKDEPDVSS